MDLNKFLNYCKHLLSTISSTNLMNGPKINIVMGTEACDLDSVVSAVVYAYFRSYDKLNKEKENTKYLPILNMKKSLRTKGEILYSFTKLNIDPDTLICINEIDLQPLKDQEKLMVTLVDHNVLSSNQNFISDEVVEIIDHHKSEMQDMYKNLTRAVIEPVGSCATLVAEEIQSKDPDILLNNKDISTLLYETILLDTNNLSTESKKATEKDIIMIEMLENILGKPDRQATYDALLKARLDISGLTFGDLLEQDLKVICDNGKKIAVPTVLKSFHDVPNLENELEKYCCENGYNATVVMGVLFNDQSIYREMAIFSVENSILRELENKLRNSENGALKLEEISQTPNMRIFKQLNKQLSRKFVLPLIRDFVKSMN